MSAKSDLQNRIDVKKSLAAKHERLASVAGSTPKRNTYLFQARRFHAQVRALETQFGQQFG
jgi:hypothetical protein